MFFSLGYEKIPREEASAAALFPAVSKFFSSSPYSQGPMWTLPASARFRPLFHGHFASSLDTYYKDKCGPEFRGGFSH